MRAGVEKAALCGVAALGGETPAGAPRARQTPTASVVLPYTRSRGAEAVALYERSGRTAMPWQRLMMEDIMAVNDEGLWVHMKFAWSIPRRNGKSELLIMCSLWALTNGRRVLYTAHRTTTSTNAWEKVVRCLTKAGFVEDEDFKTSKRQGNEQIIWLSGDGIINFRTRTSKGGLGEGYDLLIIDEAQEYTADQESALKYIVTDSKDPQTLMCGTPPTAVSAGDVFLKYRRDTLEGRNEDCGWAEWSVPALSDMTDRALWYETNPSLGYVLTERTVRNELGSDRVDGNIQRLGLWLTYSQKSAITRPDWMRCALEEAPVLPAHPKLWYGVKYSQHTGNTALAVAVRLDDGRIFVEAIDCRPTKDGNTWIIAYLKGDAAEGAVIDGAGAQRILADEMVDAECRCTSLLPRVADVVEAAALLEKQIFGGQLCHMAQPALVQTVTHCTHRAVSGGFGYASYLEGADAALVEAVMLAHWLCARERDSFEQFISY